MGFPDSSVDKESTCMVDNKKLKPPRPWFGSWVRKIPWRSDWLPTPVLLTSLVAQLVKNPPALRETWVRSLGWEDPLEKGKAAAAKSLQSCPTLCDPIDRSPPGSSVHRDSPGKNTEVGCHPLLQGIFPHPEIEPRSPALQADSLPSEPPGKHKQK